MYDLSVVGLDLTTGREVSLLDEADVPFWRRRGHVGNGTVVCLHCYTGVDVPNPRRVPVVARGRIGGQRRPHFAHPPGMAVRHGLHHPETVWHAEGKQRLAAWARRQPAVADALVEAWTADGARRSDVQVRLRTGERVALELQSRWITDDEWLARHRDYREQQISDVWLWHPHVGVPGVVPAHGRPGWLYADDHAALSALVAAGHPRDGAWWDTSDPSVYGLHWPACPDDTTRPLRIAWSDLRLRPTGLELAPEVVEGWAHQTRSTAAATAARAVTAAAAAAPAVDAAASASPAATLAGTPSGTTSTSDPAAPELLAPMPQTAPSDLPSRGLAAVRQQRREHVRRQAAPPALIRIDAQPPHRTDPRKRLYSCRACDTNLTETTRPPHDRCRLPDGWQVDVTTLPPLRRRR